MRAHRSLSSLAIFAAVSLIAAGAAATTKPTDDLVSVEDGKMVIEEYNTCRIDRPAWAAAESLPKFQLKTYSEAPKRGVISRDNFVALTMHIVIGMSRELAQLSGVAGARLSCSTIGAPIGTVDLEVNTYMTKDGVQVETVSTAQRRTSRVTFS